MKKTGLLLVLTFLLVVSSFSQKKTDSPKSCSVVLLNNQWIINSYEKDEKAIINNKSTGTLSVHETGDVSMKSFKKEYLKFRVAIQRKSDNTFVSFSDKTYNSIQVEEILKECLSGDKILIILQEANYSLPHSQLEVL